jgi:hypothetical protein
MNCKEKWWNCGFCPDPCGPCRCAFSWRQWQWKFFEINVSIISHFLIIIMIPVHFWFFYCTLYTHSWMFCFNFFDQIIWVLLLKNRKKIYSFFYHWVKNSGQLMILWTQIFRFILQNLDRPINRALKNTNNVSPLCIFKYLKNGIFFQTRALSVEDTVVGRNLPISVRKVLSGWIL